MRRPKLLYCLLLLLFLSDFTIAEDGNQVDGEAEGDNVEGDDNVQGDDNMQGGDAQIDDNLENEENMGNDDATVEGENQGDDNAQNVDEENVDEQGDDNAQNAEYDQNIDNEDAEVADSGSSSSGYYHSQNVVCSDAVIQVQDIVVYCDSPGTFYYGSGKYRNSQTCSPGDKARVVINFYIADYDMIQQAGNYALVDVYADGGYYTDSVTIYDNADLCSLSTLKKSSGNQCPYNGYYQISTHFYWGSSANVNESFDPVIHIGFKSNIKKNVYDFGGANTDLCRGSTFLSWSDGVKVSYANALENFMKTFGILLLTIIFLGILAWFLSHRPKSFKEAKTKLLALHKFPRGLAGFRGFNGFHKREPTHRELSNNPDEEFDFRKITTAGDRDLVDF